MNFKEFTDGILEYDCMDNAIISNEDFETCLDNYKQEFETEILGEDFITWVVDNWEWKD